MAYHQCQSISWGISFTHLQLATTSTTTTCFHEYEMNPNGQAVQDWTVWKDTVLWALADNEFDWWAGTFTLKVKPNNNKLYFSQNCTFFVYTYHRHTAVLLLNSQETRYVLGLIVSFFKEWVYVHFSYTLHRVLDNTQKYTIATAVASFHIIGPEISFFISTRGKGNLHFIFLKTNKYKTRMNFEYVALFDGS